MKYIKYTGAFKDLIPLGFKFQKLYAANYRCYHDYHEPAGNKEPIFWIWQKGREIEIEDWHHLSAYVVEYLIAHPFTPKASRHGEIDYIALMVNKNTCEIQERTLENSPMGISIQKLEGKIDDEEWGKRIDEHYKIFREIVVTPKNLFDKLELLKGKYEIVEEE